ncbi:hypothetical protein N475_21460 [Pseudoalteromonas luteoviolacea DSM 6061]|uniref:Uncharacterized protein n=1 Tax=Pseudoalteromonas luteoviolacea DSM 6061 TaxID=1365250 RepID=A0A166VER7_9GAMM|nr:hypothetical protein N475_21460 [Pseudoalteromonas luteoviolacea DSM 6061]
MREYYVERKPLSAEFIAFYQNSLLTTFIICNEILKFGHKKTDFRRHLTHVLLLE